MRHYTARATRSGKWWAITVDELKGAHSQAKRLDQVEKKAREVISLLTDEPADTFEVEVVQEMPAEWAGVIAGFLAFSNRVSELETRMTMAQKLVVARLSHEGLPVRDIGQLMHLSHQRVAQIAHETPPNILEDADDVLRDLGELGGGPWGLPSSTAASEGRR